MILSAQEKQLRFETRGVESRGRCKSLTSPNLKAQWQKGEKKPLNNGVFFHCTVY